VVKVEAVLDNSVVTAQEDDAVELDCGEAVGVGEPVDVIVVSTVLFAGGTDEVT
jgi:hypothetical protein